MALWVYIHGRTDRSGEGGQTGEDQAHRHPDTFALEEAEKAHELVMENKELPAGLP